MNGKANERELLYGEKLGKMIRCETISNAFQQDLSKFYRFHEVLEKLFPNIHKVCEKHEFNGSLLFKWKGKGQGEPILFMSHQDVVEASGEWKHEPFSGEIADGAVWGRGTVDTKGSLFCFLQAKQLYRGDRRRGRASYRKMASGQRRAFKIPYGRRRNDQGRAHEGSKRPVCHGRLSGKGLWRYPFYCKGKRRTCQRSPETDASYPSGCFYDGY